MSFVANPFVVVLDANVLFPFRIRDVLLTFAQEGLFRARITDEILDEWTRNLIRNKPQLEDSVHQQEAAIRAAFDECLVTGYAPLIPGLTLPDEDDRHVLAAAIKCSAQIIVTENHKDFPPDRLEEYGVETLGADDFLAKRPGLNLATELAAVAANKECGPTVGWRPENLRNMRLFHTLGLTPNEIATLISFACGFPRNKILAAEIGKSEPQLRKRFSRIYEKISGRSQIDSPAKLAHLLTACALYQS